MLTARALVQYDPLVADTACHNRAAYLVYLYRKSKSTKLSESEESYLRNCELLTTIQYRQRDAFNVITAERTDIKKIPAKLLPIESTNTKRNEFIAEKRKEVVKETLDFLVTNTSEMQFDIKQEVSTFHIATSKQRIPVAPLYYSAKMVLHYAAKEAIPLVLNVRRMSLVDSEYVLSGAVSITYSFDVNQKKFLPRECKQDQEAIAFDVVSCFVKGTENQVGGIFGIENCQLFFEALKNIDVAFLIMLYAVGHDQYPKTALPPKNAGNLKLFDPKINSSQEVKMDSVDLNSCTDKEYQGLFQVANRYGFFRKEARYGNKTCLSFIDHAYATTVQQCQEETAKLLKTHEAVVVERKLVGSSS